MKTIKKVCHPRVLLAGILFLLSITCLPQSSPAQWFGIPPKPVTIDTAAIVGYKVYSILITQSGVDAPTVTVLHNTLGFNPTWDYRGEGIYGCTFPGGFLGGTLVFIQDNHMLYDNITLGDVYWTYIEKFVSSILLYCYAPNGGGAINGVLNNTFLEFRIYL